MPSMTEYQNALRRVSYATSRGGGSQPQRHARRAPRVRYRQTPRALTYTHGHGYTFLHTSIRFRTPLATIQIATHARTLLVPLSVATSRLRTVPRSYTILTPDAFRLQVERRGKGVNLLF